MIKQPTQKSFLNDVKNHAMTVNVNLPNGYRHLVFSAPDTRVQSFEIITTPARLFYTGDMGSFTFGREYADMIYFFANSGNGINIDYWTEKLLAAEDDYKQFDFDTYYKSIIEHCKENDFDSESMDDVESCFSVIETVEVINHKLSDFLNNEDLRWFTHYSYRYLWCLYAINWGCKKFLNDNI